MGGLLGGLFGDDSPQISGGLLGNLSPKDLGVLMTGAKLLEMSGPSRVPISLGQGIGAAMTTGIGSYMGAQDRLTKQEEERQMAAYRRAQTAALEGKTKSEQQIDDIIAKRFGRGLPVVGGAPGAPGGAAGAPQAQDLPGFGTVPGLPAGAVSGVGLDAGGLPSLPPQVGGAPGVPPQGPGRGEAFPFSINDIALLKLRGRDLSDIYKLATDPVKMEGGSLYRDRATGEERYIPKLGEGMTFSPNGVSVVSGYSGANAEVKGAEMRATEGAKADFAPLPLNFVGQDGRPIGGTVGAYVRGGQQDAGQLPPGPPQGAGAGGAGFPRVDPNMQRQRDAESLRIIQGEYANERDPNNRAALSREIARLQASVGGAGGRPPLQSEAEKTAQLGAITGRQATVTDLNKNWITQSYNPVLEAGRAATSITSSLDALGNINAQTGWGAEAKAHAASVLTGLGVAPRNVKFYAANAEKFQSVAMDRLLTTLAAQKGPQTEGDAQRAQAAFAQLKNTPEANRFISNFARAKTNYDARRAQFYQDALPLAQQSGDLNEIDRRWQKIAGSIWSDPVLQRYVRKK